MSRSSENWVSFLHSFRQRISLNSLQLDLLRRLTGALVGLNIAVMNHLHQAECWLRERGPAWSCPRCYIRKCVPLPEPLTDCLASISAQKQSSWSGHHSRQQHFTEHINISPALSPGEMAVCREDGGRDRKRDRQKEGDCCVDGNICSR